MADHILQAGETIDVSICVVNWNTERLLRACIESVYRYTKGVTFELIVVDNNSSDNSVQMVRENFPRCFCVAMPDNVGFVKGNNVAFGHAKGRYVCMLNPDTELFSDILTDFVEFLDRSPEYTAAGPRLVSPDGSIQFTCARTFPSAWNQFCFLAMLNKVFKKSRFFTTVELTCWDHIDSRDADCISGACIFVRHEFIREHGGLDENIFMYAEDVDLCWRIIKNGGKIRYLADKEVLHVGGAASRQQRQRIFSSLMLRTSNVYIIAKHRGVLNSFLYRMAVLAGSMFRVCLLLFTLPACFVVKRKQCAGLVDLLIKYWLVALWSVGLKRAGIR